MKFTPKVLLTTMVAAGALVTASAFADNVAAATSSDVSKQESIMNQNSYGPKNAAGLSSDWFQRIHVSGLANVDAGYSNVSSQKGSNYHDDTLTGANSSSDISLSNANVFVDACLNDFSSAHLNVAYADNSLDTLPVRKVHAEGTGDVAYMEEAYVSLHNFAQSPFYATIGKQYVGFGSYDAHPMYASLSQLLSQTNATALQLGMVLPQGVYGDVFGFRGVRPESNRTLGQINTFGGQLGFASTADDVSFDLGLGYISDMASSVYAQNQLFLEGNRTDYVGLPFARNNVAAWNMHLALASGPFYGKAALTRAIDTFNKADFSYPDNTLGAKPVAYDVNLGYHFKTAAHDSSFELGYGHSAQASGNGTSNNGTLNAKGLYLPRNRYEALYNVNVMPNTDIGFGLVNDHDYSVENGGSGKTATTGTVRLSVQFA